MKRSFALLSLVMALCLCSCTSSGPPAADAPTETTQAPTATVCTHSYETSILEEATCLQEGSMEHRCSLCSDSKTEAIPANGHSFLEGKCTKCDLPEPTFAAITARSWMLTNPTEDGQSLLTVSLEFSESSTGSLLISTFPHCTEDEAKALEPMNYAIFEYEGQLYYYNGSTSKQYYFDFTTDNGSILCSFGQDDSQTATLSLALDGEHKINVTDGSQAFIENSAIDVIRRVGAFGCKHTYEGTITQTATCQQAGVSTFVCATCGDQFQRKIPARHSYQEGVCALCGYAAPYCPLDTGTWVLENPHMEGTRVQVTHISFRQGGEWGAVAHISEYADKDSMTFGYSFFAPWANDTYVYQDKLYYDELDGPVFFLANFTEQPDGSVVMEVGLKADEGSEEPYIIFYTITLQRIGNNQYVITVQDLWDYYFVTGGVFTCYDF